MVLCHSRCCIISLLVHLPLQLKLQFRLARLCRWAVLTSQQIFHLLLAMCRAGALFLAATASALLVSAAFKHHGTPWQLELARVLTNLTAQALALLEEQPAGRLRLAGQSANGLNGPRAGTTRRRVGWASWPEC